MISHPELAELVADWPTLPVLSWRYAYRTLRRVRNTTRAADPALPSPWSPTTSPLARRFRHASERTTSARSIPGMGDRTAASKADTLALLASQHCFRLVRWQRISLVGDLVWSATGRHW
jgi:hypothetical protein